MSPSSFLEFSVQNRLLCFAEWEISTNKAAYMDDLSRPTMLYYSLTRNARAQGWKDFAKFLLENDCNPNGVLSLCVGYDVGKLMPATPFKITPSSLCSEESSSDIEIHLEDSDARENGVDNNSVKSSDIGEIESVGSENEVDNDHLSLNPKSKLEPEEYFENITMTHLALAIACTYGDWHWRKGRINRLDMLRILIEGGRNADVRDYRNHWGSRPNEALERSAINYFLYLAPGGKNPFNNVEISCAPSQCITSFLDHEADPNAVNSDGISILECALPTCPLDLVKLMLEKGAKVTPKLLTESGTAIGDADGILYQPCWRRPE